MPVSTKRKKDGKPVRRAQRATAATGEAASTPSTGAEAADQQPKIERRIGKPRNPFVERQGHKASQRGR
jgi:hypothetical protein